MKARALLLAALLAAVVAAHAITRESAAAEVRTSTSPASGQGLRAKPATGVLRLAPDKRSGRPALRLPAWAKKKPHFVERGGRRFGVAVGRSSGIKNQALARNTAANRGRAELLRLLKGQAAGSDVEGELSGAEVVDTFTTRNGRVYVRVEAKVSR